MKKIFRTVLTGLLVTSFALTGVTTVSAKNVNKEEVSSIVAFGDSFSDNGQANAISKEILALPVVPEGAYEKPGDLYWENRYSNGKTSIEVAADKMEVPLTNYAVGGAKSDYTNISPWMDTIVSTGMLGQVDRYIASLDGEEIDVNTLHFIAIGGNDAPSNPDDIFNVADKLVANVEASIRKLTDLGAEKFLVGGLMESAIVPSRVQDGPDRVEAGKIWSDYANETLFDMVKNLEKELDIQIETADIAKEMRKVANNPAKYDIKHVSIPAQPTWPELLPGSETPNDYFFFDEWHPTASGHEILGEVIYKAATKIK